MYQRIPCNGKSSRLSSYARNEQFAALLAQPTHGTAMQRYYDQSSLSAPFSEMLHAKYQAKSNSPADDESSRASRGVNNDQFATARAPIFKTSTTPKFRNQQPSSVPLSRTFPTTGQGIAAGGKTLDSISRSSSMIVEVSETSATHVVSRQINLSGVGKRPIHGQQRGRCCQSSW